MAGGVWQICGGRVAGVGGRCVAVSRFSVAVCPVCLSERSAGVWQLVVLVWQLRPVCVSVNVAGVLFQRGS